jgi:hypothetical protein
VVSRVTIVCSTHVVVFAGKLADELMLEHSTLLPSA